MGKKVYFCGSIRAGRADAACYRLMIEAISRRATVLTEHVGSEGLNLMQQARARDASIYDRDIAWIRQSNLVIAECTNPSLGVGYELAYAECLRLPCHVFYDKARTQLSAMINGNPYFITHPYSDTDELLAQLERVLDAS